RRTFPVHPVAVASRDPTCTGQALHSCGGSIGVAPISLSRRLVDAANTKTRCLPRTACRDGRTLSGAPSFDGRMGCACPLRRAAGEREGTHRESDGEDEVVSPLVRSRGRRSGILHLSPTSPPLLRRLSPRATTRGA